MVRKLLFASLLLSLVCYQCIYAQFPLNNTKNLGFNERECAELFPGYDEELIRAFDYYMTRPLHERQKSSEKRLPNDSLHVKIRNKGLYIIETGEAEWSYRGLAILNQIFTAIKSTSDRIPDIEFFVNLNDIPGMEGAWSLTRRNEDHSVVLMPDFGYWSWPEPKVGTYARVRAKSEKINKEYPWNNKTDKLLFRGALDIDHEGVRGHFENATKGKAWADIKNINWADPTNVNEVRMNMEDHCKWKYLAHTEGLSYSGRLKYLLLCESVIVSHDSAWMQHFHHQLVSWPPKNKNESAWANVGESNIVVVDRNFSELSRVMDYLISNPEVAQKIVSNSVKTMRDKYLTPACLMCYWRALFRYWDLMVQRDRINFGKQRWKDERPGTAFESYALMRQIDWQPH